MSSIVVMKDDTGRLSGATERDRKAYAKFKKAIEDLAPGELFTLSHWFPRNAKLHRLHFAMLAAVYEQQEQFADIEQFRMWVQVGAGWCDFLPGPKGRMVAVPKSISFSALDDADFQDHHEKVKDFLRNDHALGFLWPHLEAGKRAEMIDAVLKEFEQ